MAPLVWSPASQMLFRQLIVKPLRARSPDWPNSVLGVPYADIQSTILEMGRADFRIGCTHSVAGTITAEDRVALYCYMNMRSHFYASLATYAAFKLDIAPAFGNAEVPLFVDLGSGPGTSALAFAEHLSGKASFDYAPIDIAQPMLDQAARFFSGAKASGVGMGSLRNYISGSAAHRSIIFNASYLFSSDSLDIAWIVDLVKEAVAKRDFVLFIYTNSTNSLAGRKWTQFCAALGMADAASQETVAYMNNRGDQTPKTVSFMRAVVRMK